MAARTCCRDREGTTVVVVVVVVAAVANVDVERDGAAGVAGADGVDAALGRVWATAEAAAVERLAAEVVAVVRQADE